MISTEFEDPAKTELRAACEVAIDQAGYQLASKLERVKMPDGLFGVLRGDLQSVDANNQRTFYYIRSVEDDVLPKWLATIARASHQLRAGEMYIVVQSYSSQFKQSCANAGAGLLVLNEDTMFDVVLSWSEVAPATLEENLEDLLKQLRRDMETKLKLATEGIQARHERITNLVFDMADKAGDEYLRKIESEYKETEDWGIEVSRLLDGVTSTSQSGMLARIREMVDVGPQVSSED